MKRLCVLAFAAFVLATPVRAMDAAAPPQAAPSPARLADKTPNWTGFWTLAGGLMDRNFGPGAVARSPRNGGPPPNRFPNPALKSPFKERYEVMLKEAAAGIVTNDPTARCLPPGMPRMMGATYGMEILQTAGQVTITSEWGPGQRRIYTDGRPLPSLDEVLPTYAGYSIGRWEGDVLIAETIGVRDDVPLNQSGLPNSGNMRIVERFYQSEPGILTIDTTIIDPEVFVEPWKMSRNYRFRPELALQEFVCLENNRNVGENGEPVFK